MRIFVAGATGAIGRRLIPVLVQAGHSVGMTRWPGKTSVLRAASAEPVVADALDANAVMATVCQAAPEVVVYRLTALPALLDFRKLDQQFAVPNRLRTEGTKISWQLPLRPVPAALSPKVLPDGPTPARVDP